MEGEGGASLFSFDPSREYGRNNALETETETGIDVGGSMTDDGTDGSLPFSFSSVRSAGAHDDDNDDTDLMIVMIIYIIYVSEERARKKTNQIV